MNRPRVAFLTLGCPKNEVDTRTMSNLVRNSSGFELADSIDGSDVAVVNTCSFIEAATSESIETVLELAGEWKAADPGRTLLVAGCMPSRYGEELASEMHEVDGFVPVSDESRILEILEKVTGAAAGATEGNSPREAGPMEYLKISEGCNKRCSYCTIPSIRGPHRSRPIESIVAEATGLVAEGAKEIVVVGQDVSAFGSDTGVSLPSLVRRLAAVEDLVWLRLMYLQPDGITDELLDVVAGEGTVLPYFDVPLQHASAGVLRRMGRGGDADVFLELLARIRSAAPNAVLRTTFIAGHPGETEADVDLLEDFLDEASMDYVGVFPYSREEGTASARMPDQVAAEVVLERTQRLRDAADKISFSLLEARIGSTLDVLVEPDSDEGPAGRFWGQAPEIDGIVHLDREQPPGRLVRAAITDAAGYDLFGEVLE